MQVNLFESFSRLVGRRGAATSSGAMLIGLVLSLTRRNAFWFAAALQLVSLVAVLGFARREESHRRVGVHVELWSMGALRELVDPQHEYSGASGPMGIDPQFMHEIVAHIISADHIETVLECGSGASTVWIALALRMRGSGRLISLEPDDGFCELTTSRLRALGLENSAEVRLAPVTRAAGGDGDWYDAAALDGVNNVSVALIDGPEGTANRPNAFPRLSSLLAPDCVVFVDDADLGPVRKMIVRWIRSGALGAGTACAIGSGGAPSSCQVRLRTHECRP